MQQDLDKERQLRQTCSSTHFSFLISLAMFHHSGPLPPPRPSKDYQHVRTASLAAALVKLDIKISVEDLLKAIHDEDEAMRAEQSAKRKLATYSLLLPFDKKPVGCFQSLPSQRKKLVVASLTSLGRRSQMAKSRCGEMTGRSITRS